MSSGNLFLADNSGKRCIICDTNRVILQEVRLQAPWDVFREGREILVTSYIVISRLYYKII